jgi:eukaryotic-like serine/threonine-protein kinase
MDTLGLKNYRVVKKIGQGGMGVVYLAEDLALRRLVALKFLAPYLVRDPEILKRFRAEARSQARLMHPHITMVYSFEEVGDQAFLVLEYVEGDTLEHRIKQHGRYPAGETAVIMAKILGAMDYAHGRGVVHRDIKPANIGFTREGVVKLMDFGIALNLVESSRLTRTGHILGTPHYMAPEQILGRPLDTRTDIYALGITLFEMLSGRPPFEGDSDYAVSVAQINDPPPSLMSFGHADITPGLEAVVYRALAKEPDERFSTAGEFLKELEIAVSFPPPGPGLPDLDKSTQRMGHALGQPPLVDEPSASAGSVTSLRPKRRVGLWLGLVTLTCGVLAVGLLISRPLSMPNWLGFGPVPQLKTIKKEGRPRAEAKAPQGQPAPAPLLLAKPKNTEVSDLKEEKKSGVRAGPAITDVRDEEKSPRQALAAASFAPTPPPKPDIPKAPEKEPAEFVDMIKGKLEEKGFSEVTVSLDAKKRLTVSGQVKTKAQRDQIISLVKDSGFPGAVDYGKLTVARRVSQKPARKKVVREEPTPSIGVPMKPLGPKLD